MSQFTAIELIELLRDRLKESADCMSADIENIRRNGLCAADMIRMIENARYFVSEADVFLAASKKEVPA
ncbi:hypothetical protein [Photobacterium galatheae]|uniref:Uncharacterized protein n=1 Tax=Photobacterium galatheae TaxID=1654360 RepID=A0A066RPY6_9GAMM|nr:hypothetical protein [Photobacterium galatheae]KDM89717.1 hypothetical protein EA58_21155 [Photobacterium galatheae]MCM0151531.1 hypothetical protein [Photobacterium galatheae]